MDYNTILELAVELGYGLAICGAETFRVEESITRVLQIYGITPEVFAIPNNLLVSIETEDHKPMTRMRRIGYHGNDLDSVERFSNLSRRICEVRPDPKTALEWLHQVNASRKQYRLGMRLLGSLIGAAGYAVFFGGSIMDFLAACLCGILVGFVSYFFDKKKVNFFFSTMVCSFLMAVLAYVLHNAGIADNADHVIIGTLMILLPGLVFTNETGKHLCHQTIGTRYKKLVKAAGLPDARFHDMRHSYAVAAIRAGDDIKTVQSNLGHHSAAFTLDTYAHATAQMKKESADRMQAHIQAIKPCKG